MIENKPQVELLGNSEQLKIGDLKAELTDLISCALSDLTATKSILRAWEDRGDRLSYEIIGHYLRDAQERLDSILKIVGENHE